MDGISLQAGAVASGARFDALERIQNSASTVSPAKAAERFEELFATMLVKEMRSGLSEGFFGSGPQSDVYGGWLDQFVGAAIARDGGLHIADGIERSLERKQAAERAAREAQTTGADSIPQEPQP